jgi:cell division protein FtsL
MASTARAYQAPLRVPRVRPDARPDIRVFPGKGTDRDAHAALDPAIITCFKIALVAVLVIAAVGVCRVWLSASTVSHLIVSEQLSSQITSARAAGSDLEIQQSILANPSRIQSIATETLGMTSASGSTYIDLASGVLAKDNSGDLSLAGSLAVIDPSIQETSASSDSQTLQYG